MRRPVAARGAIRYTNQGGDPADGALNSAVIAEPLSSTRAGQPAVGPAPRHIGDDRGVGDDVGFALRDQIELVGGDAQRAPRVACEVPTLAACARRSRTRRRRRPTGADPGDVWAAVAVDRRQPAGVPVRATGPGGLAHPLVEAVDDAIPVEQWGSVEVGEVGGVQGIGRRSAANSRRVMTLPSRLRDHARELEDPASAGGAAR